MYFQNLYGLKGIGEEISPPNKLSKLLLLTLFTRVKSIYIIFLFSKIQHNFGISKNLDK